MKMLGYAIGPLVFAPLSEVYGRSPIYHLGNVFYTAFRWDVLWRLVFLCFWSFDC